MAIIILITLIALFITASGYFKNTKQGNWYAFIIAVVIFSAYTAITTELLKEGGDYLRRILRALCSMQRQQTESCRFQKKAINP